MCEDICLIDDKEYSKYRCSENICNILDSKDIYEKCHKCKYGIALINTCSMGRYMHIRYTTNTDIDDTEIRNIEDVQNKNNNHTVFTYVLKDQYEKYPWSNDFGVSYIKILMSQHGYIEHADSDMEVRGIAESCGLNIVIRRKRSFILNDNNLYKYIYGKDKNVS